GGRDVDLLGQARDDEDEAEDLEHEDLVARRGQETREQASAARGDEEGRAHREQGHRKAPGGLGEREPGQDRGDDRQIEGHDEVFGHQQGEHGGGLAVAEPAEVGEDFGDDARGGHVGDAAEDDGGQRAPAEQQCAGRSGGEVQRQVDERGLLGGAQRAGELPGSVYETESEQLQHDADLGADLEEVGERVEIVQAAVDERQTGEEVEGDRGDGEPAGDGTEDAEGPDDQTQFEEYFDEVVHALLESTQDALDFFDGLGGADGDQPVA